MKNLVIVFAALTLSLLGSNVYGWGTTGGDGERFTQLQETAVYFNNSGGTRSAGDVVILDTFAAGVNTATTLGSYVRLSDGLQSAQADSVLVVGVVRNTSNDQTPVVVVTKGPISATCADSSDAVTLNVAVGTTDVDSLSGQCGGGTNLGIALEAGSGSDGASLRIWVSPTGAD